MKKISLLGATGSVGSSTINILDRWRDHFKLQAASAHTNVEALADIARRFLPAVVAIGDERYHQALKEAVADLPVEVLAGPEGLCRVARETADVIVSSIVGLAGLEPTLAAIESQGGKVIAIANKESLVTAAPLIFEAARRSGAVILPVDSEHNALFQLLGGHAYLNPSVLDGVDRLVITASGGPFWEQGDLTEVTPEQACQHPVWSMGKKISVDSATMVNKALELAEASVLFGKPESEIDILVHRQAWVHAMVRYRSGVVHMNASVPNMEVALASTLFWPSPAPLVDNRYNLASCLQFEQPDDVRFPAIPLMRCVLRENNPLLLTVFNAANEVAVMLFLSGKVKFSDITQLIKKSLEENRCEGTISLEKIYTADKQVREFLVGAYA